MTDEVKSILQRITGTWTGSEKMIVDPDNGAEMTTEAKLTNTPCLGGNGFVSDYVQMQDGQETMRCQTTYRFDTDDAVTAFWIPSKGDFQNFSGICRGGVVEVSRTDEDGMKHSLKTDYSKNGVFSTQSTIAPPSGPEMIIFEGTYTKSEKW